jgi:SPP1 family predicted phage head-tail adaptor
MSPGDLTDRITVFQKTTVTDAQGGRSTTWAALGNQPSHGLAANVRALDAGERIQAAAIGSHLRYVVTIYYRADVTPSMRVSWTPYKATTAKTLEIAGVQPVDSARVWTTLDCGEVL